MTKPDFKTAVWLAIVAIVVTGLVAAWWRADEARLHADVVLTASGWVVGILGFSLTLWQIRSTASAAEAAKKAVSEVRAHLRRYDTITEVARAEDTLRSIVELHNLHRWKEAAEKYASAKKSLRTLRKMHSSITAQENDALENAFQQLTKMSVVVEQHLHGGGPEPNIADSNIAILRQIDVLTDISLSIKESVGSDGP